MTLLEPLLLSDHQRSTDSTRLSTLPVSRQCVPPRARHPSNPIGPISYLLVLDTQCRPPITELILVCMPPRVSLRGLKSLLATLAIDSILGPYNAECLMDP